MDDMKIDPMASGERSIGRGIASLRIRRSTALPVAMQPRTREVVDFTVKPAERNKGYGTRLLRKVCEEADEANIILVLWPKPYGDEPGVELNALVEWYNRDFGFAVIQSEPELLMARLPNSTPVAMRLKPITEAIYKGKQA